MFVFLDAFSSSSPSSGLGATISKMSVTSHGSFRSTPPSSSNAAFFSPTFYSRLHILSTLLENTESDMRKQRRSCSRTPKLGSQCSLFCLARSTTLPETEKSPSDDPKQQSRRNLNIFEGSSAIKFLPLFDSGES